MSEETKPEQMPLITDETKEQIKRIICCFSTDNKSCYECVERSPDGTCFDDIRDESEAIIKILEAKLAEQKKQEADAFEEAEDAYSLCSPEWRDWYYKHIVQLRGEAQDGK
jgi:hypothetical protein